MVLSRPISAILLGTGLTLLGCTPTPEPLPTQEAIKNLDRNQAPPLYQLLYDIPALPAFGPEEQRVRILIWLRHLDLNPGQLTRLDELRALADERRGRIMAAEEEAGARWKKEESGIYQRIWDHITAGNDIDDPDMAALTH